MFGFAYSQAQSMHFFKGLQAQTLQAWLRNLAGIADFALFKCFQNPRQLAFYLIVNLLEFHTSQVEIHFFLEAKL